MSKSYKYSIMDILVTIKLDKRQDLKILVHNHTSILCLTLYKTDVNFGFKKEGDTWLMLTKIYYSSNS